MTGSMFVDFDENEFPMVVTLYRGDEIVWEALIPGPGALRVPKLGGITRCLMKTGSGTVYDSAED